MAEKEIDIFAVQIARGIEEIEKLIIQINNQKQQMVSTLAKYNKIKYMRCKDCGSPLSTDFGPNNTLYGCKYCYEVRIKAQQPVETKPKVKKATPKKNK